jgi:hypothetical protein
MGCSELAHGQGVSTVPGWWLVVLSVGVIVAAGVYVAVGPIVATEQGRAVVTGESAPSGADHRTQQDETVERSTHGLGMVPAAAVTTVPLLLAIPALVARRRRRLAVATRIGASALMWVFVVLTGFSVGLLFMPAAILMLVAAAVGARQAVDGSVG